MRLKHLLSVFLMLITLSVGNVWGASATWALVTSEPSDWSGEYLIVYNSNCFDGSLTSGLNGNAGQSVSISNNKITKDDSYSLTVSKVSGKYYLQTASGYYIGRSANSNGVDANTSKSNSYEVTFGSWNGTNKTVKIAGTGGRCLGNNSGSWKFFASSNAYVNVSLYKKEASSKTLSSIAITTQPNTRKYLVGDSFSKTGAVVRATYSDNSTADVSSSATWTPSGALTAGTSKTMTASYTESSTTKTATTTVDVYSVTVQKQDETGATITADGVTASVSGRTLSASATAASKYVFKGWKFGTASGTSIASASSASTSLTGTPTAAVTVIAEFYKPVTITWNKNDAEYETTTVARGSKPVFPDDPSSCDATSNTFYGWATSTWENAVDNLTGKTVYTSAGDMPDVTNSVTYNAVFAKASGGGNEWVLCSAVNDVSAGTYVITGDNAYYLGSESEVIKNPAATSGITISNNKLSNTVTSAMQWTFSGDNSDGWLISHQKGNTTYYLCASDAAQGISVKTSDDNTRWIVSVNNTKGMLLNGEGSRYLSYRSSSSDWRNYSSSDYVGTLRLYKQQSNISYSKYRTLCCTPLGQINGAVSMSLETTGTHAGDLKCEWTLDGTTLGSLSTELWKKGVAPAADTKVSTDSRTISATKQTVYYANPDHCATYYVKLVATKPATGNYCENGWTKTSNEIETAAYSVTKTGVTLVTDASLSAIPTTTCPSGFNATIEAAIGYDLPSTITVTGASSSWNQSTGALGVSSVTGNVAITITPTAHNYTITYNNMDGATNDANNPATYKITDSDITLGTPTKDGWTFEGWFNNSDLAEEHKVTGVAIAAGSHENKSFYAKWVQKVTLTKASASHGSFVLSSSNTGSPEISSVYTNNAAQTVYVVCTPADGYEVNEVSQSGINSGVTIGGSGNARTIEYAQGANGSSEVSVSFSCVNPSISVHPASANYAQNAEATALTVTASANNASLGYLWQSSSNNSNWSAAAGTNNQQTYTPSTATANTTYYRVIVTNNASGCGLSTPSNAATITVSASVCADPTFSVSGGTYNANQSVEISCATGGAIIRYTTDGNDPTESSPVYSSAISITQTTTLKAKAFKSEWTASNITSATYTLKCAAPTFNKGTNTYLGAQEITLSCVTEGAKIYYTMDGSAPSSTNGTEYTAAITVSSNQTIKAIAVKDGWSDSDIDFATYTIQYTVTWNDNSGQIHSQAVTCGSNVYSCPSDPSLDNNCGSKFMGWTTNSTYKGNSAPADLFTDTSGTKPTITGDTDFYAVFADYAN